MRPRLAVVLQWTNLLSVSKQQKSVHIGCQYHSALLQFMPQQKAKNRYSQATWSFLQMYPVKAANASLLQQDIMALFPVVGPAQKAHWVSNLHQDRYAGPKRVNWCVSSFDNWTHHEAVEVQQTRNESKNAEKLEQIPWCKEWCPFPLPLCGAPFIVFLNIPAGCAVDLADVWANYHPTFFQLLECRKALSALSLLQTWGAFNCLTYTSSQIKQKPRIWTRCHHTVFMSWQVRLSKLCCIQSWE